MLLSRTVARSNGELVDNLKHEKIVTSNIVEETLKAVDRSYFTPNSQVAFIDLPQDIGYDATISSPHITALILELLRDKLPNGKILDVGCGSGYTATLFARMAGDTGKVLAIDNVQELVDQCIKNIETSHNYYLKTGRVEVRKADAWNFSEQSLRFDVIHIGASVEEVPDNLINLLAPGGIMIVPIGRAQQKLTLLKKSYKGEIDRTLTKIVIFERLAKEGESRGVAKDTRNPFDSRTAEERKGVKSVTLDNDERRAPRSK
eukprot:TRINITY_DN8164_c0_g1_i1.p1 TRINITY_DN8164_c0_g1~~TRINITY_DN8164_c0_g1_i1.p1  ORF type:complete len:268 (-),score=52.71 TRINITY_DN8164_c0_g1_i1:15-797(-)